MNLLLLLYQIRMLTKNFITKKAIKILIAFLFISLKLVSQTNINIIYVLNETSNCVSCLSDYGECINKIDFRFKIIFVNKSTNAYYIEQEKQYIKNVYLIKKNFDLIQSDSLFFHLKKLLKKRKNNSPSIFIETKKNFIEYKCNADELCDFLPNLTTSIKPSITVKTKKMQIDSEYLFSCPFCFASIINETFILGSIYASKLLYFPIGNKGNSLNNKIDFNSENNLLKIYKKFNSGDSNYFEGYKNTTSNKLMTIACVPGKDELFFSNLYTTIKIDSLNVSLGAVKDGIITLSKNFTNIDLLPIKFRDSDQKSLNFANFFNLGNDTLIFMVKDFAAEPICDDYLLAKFKKYNNDSIVFVDYIKSFKFKCNNKPSFINSTKMINNKWVLIAENEVLYNVISDKQFIFKIDDLINHFKKKKILIDKNITWIDIKESNLFLNIVFINNERLFNVYISKDSGKILNAYSYNIFNDQNKNLTQIINYNDGYYYLTIDSNLVEIKFN